MTTFPFFRHLQHANLDQLAQLESGDYQAILTSSLAHGILNALHPGVNVDHAISAEAWLAELRSNITKLMAADDAADVPNTKPSSPSNGTGLQLIGTAALQAFLQSNVTGPPLSWDPASTILPLNLRSSPEVLRVVRERLVASLAVDGEAPWIRTPHVELFCVAKAIWEHEAVVRRQSWEVWGRARMKAWWARLIGNEIGDEWQKSLMDDWTSVGELTLSSEERVRWLLEQAALMTFLSKDAVARENLHEAERESGLQFVLTGRLGKRTKWQDRDISQLVVLAQSRQGGEDESVGPKEAISKGTSKGISKGISKEISKEISEPRALNLDDDTLLEAISFSNPPTSSENDEESIAPALASLDPSNQPKLRPCDAILLLSFASSITNTSPQHGLTREETLPYASRVLADGSTNWQIYTQALLLRSRIEGYRSRTVERGVLQLQALVDQVIAETTSAESSRGNHLGASEVTAPVPLTSTSQKETDDEKPSAAPEQGPSTFLPRPAPSDAAPATTRLLYIDALASPTRWALEAELAAKWVSVGGLRTALEIYERLEMWAEVALCWAATDREDRAIEIVRRQLYQPLPAEASSDDGQRERGPTSPAVSPLPPSAPRLLCILGDLESSPAHYHEAWEVSGRRYARAQRSLGKHHLKRRELDAAGEAYALSLTISPQDTATWFALGAVRLEQSHWAAAVECYSRVVGLEPEDAEAWSNLAAGLLRVPMDQEDGHDSSDDGKRGEKRDEQPTKRREAFLALKRAAILKRDSFRIWHNLLAVGASLSPPPYSDMLLAQQRIIELRGGTEGESCIDEEILEAILAHLIAASASDTTSSNANQRRATAGIPPNTFNGSVPQSNQRNSLDQRFSALLTTQVIPLITHSRRLWKLVGRHALYQDKPSAALDAYEKAWRVALQQPGWDDESTPRQTADTVWQDVVEATQELVDAYESLGERPRTEGLGAGELVCKNWRYKARMAVRSVVGRREKAGVEVGDMGGLRERTF